MNLNVEPGGGLRPQISGHQRGQLRATTEGSYMDQGTTPPPQKKIVLEGSLVTHIKSFEERGTYTSEEAAHSSGDSDPWSCSETRGLSRFPHLLSSLTNPAPVLLRLRQLEVV